MASWVCACSAVYPGYPGPEESLVNREIGIGIGVWALHLLLQGVLNEPSLNLFLGQVEFGDQIPSSLEVWVWLLLEVLFQ